MTEQQLTEQDLTRMSPEEIEEARAAGRLNALLGRPVTPASGGQLTDAQVAAMSPEDIVAAHDAGQLDSLLGRAE